MCFMLKIAGKCFIGFSLDSASVSAEYLKSRSELAKPSDCLEPRLVWGW